MFTKRLMTTLALVALCSLFSTQSVSAFSPSMGAANSDRFSHEYSTLIGIEPEAAEIKLKEDTKAAEKVQNTKEKPSSTPTTKETKENKATAKCSEALYSEGCFTDCLARSVPPDVLLSCTEACGNLQITTCAVCLGVGAYVVWSCYSACGFAPEAPPEN